MRVVFRCEGSYTLGLGHISRCLVLAEELVRRGYEVVFIAMSFTIEKIKALDSSHAFLCVIMPHLLSENEDAAYCMEWLQQKPEIPTWIIVDHYDLGFQWESKLLAVSQVIVLDDLAREHMCHILVDTYIGRDNVERYQNKLPSVCNMLLGAEYALLRQAFSSLRARVDEQVCPNVANIFLCFGGSDSLGVTLTVLSILKKMHIDCHIHAVVGAGFQHTGVLQSTAESMENVCIYVNHPSPEKLMVQCDMAIGAGGIMSLERCSLGLPSLVMSIAENQVSNCTALDAIGAIRYLGSVHQIDEGGIAEAINQLMCDCVYRQRMRDRSMKLVDGLGAMRVVDMMMSYTAA